MELINSPYAQITELKNKISELETKNKELAEQKAKSGDQEGRKGSTLLMESILVTGVAGYAGLVLGVGLLELVSFALRTFGAKLDFFDNPEVNFKVVMISLMLLVVVGALAGLMPALKAARIMPIEAMRAD